MAERQAVFGISVTGDDDLVRAGERIQQKWASIGGTVKDSVGGAVRSVASAAASLAQDTIRVATAMGSINIAQLAADSKTLNLQISRYAVGNRQNLRDLKQETDALAKKLLLPSIEVARTAQGFAKLSYSTKTAQADLEALNELATEQGRELGDELPLGVMLRKALGPTQSMRGEIAKLGEQSTALGYNGGPTAFTEMLTSVSDALQQVTMDSNDARTKVTGFLGALTKGADRDQQKRVANSVIRNIEADPVGWSRTVGYDVLNKETGKIDDPAKVMLDYKNRVEKIYGKTMGRAVMRNALGSEAGTYLSNFDASAFERSKSVDWGTATSTAEEAQKRFAASEAAKQRELEIKKQNDAREAIGGPLASMQNAWNEMFAGSPKAELAASGAVGATASALFGKIAGVASGVLGKGQAAKEVLTRAPQAIARFAGSAGTAAETAGVAEGAAATAGGVGAGTMFGLLAATPVAEYYAVKGINALHDQRKAEVEWSMQQGQATEGASRIAQAAQQGQYASIYEATPDLLRFARGAAGGTTVDQQAVMRQMVTLLANRKDLPPEFAATVKQAFKEALRESEVTVTSPNPSRRAVNEIESREN